MRPAVKDSLDVIVSMDLTIKTQKQEILRLNKQLERPDACEGEDFDLDEGDVLNAGEGDDINAYEGDVIESEDESSDSTIVVPSPRGKSKKRFLMKDTRSEQTSVRSVFLSGVENSLTKQEVSQAFANFGAIESVSMSKQIDSSSKKHAKQHTIITFNNRESQSKAIESKQIVIKDRRYDITLVFEI